jgi:hypothetical protein
MKSIFEIEREKLESRVQEEKDKSNKKLSIIHEELEEKIKEEIQEKEDEIDELQSRLMGEQ